MVVDPISLIGLAANILQFIEFGSKLVSESRTIYRSATGVSDANVEIETVTEHLCSYLQKLSATNPPPGDATDLEKQLYRLANACSSVAGKLLGAVEELKVDMSKTPNGPSRKWKSICLALQTIRKQKTIDDLRQRMDSVRSELLLHLQTLMNEQLSSIQLSLSNHGQDTDKYILASLKDIELERLEALDGLLATLKQLTEGYHLQPNGTVISDEIRKLQLQISGLKESSYDLSIKSDILMSLCYPTMTERRSNIASAHANTFEWPFKPAPSDLDPQQHLYFYNWLQSDKSIYWISGKPGSGKSTLMKYLYGHKKTREALELWAKSSQLFMADFYFWITGTPIQKSIQGLFQSLLFGILLQCPDMIPWACPNRWPSSTGKLRNLPPWDSLEVQETLKKVILEVSGSTSNKFCFFIDGLDEYNGDLQELLDLLKDISGSSNVKLCLSSRPWNIIENALGRDKHLKLYLEDLTRNDIRRYIFDKLEHPFVDSFPTDLLGQSKKLLHEVVDKAQGVFLWVYLVVRSLKEGLTNADSLQTLEARVHAFPSDLYDFFLHMFKLVGKVYQHQSATIFRVALDNPHPLPLYLYGFLMEDDPDFAIKLPMRSISLSERVNTAIVAKKRLFARSQGLLEIYKPDNLSQVKPIGDFSVGLLHRTVRDFLCTKEMWQLLQEILGEGFHPAVPLGRAFLAARKTGHPHHGDHALQKILDLTRRVEREAGTSDNAMLDELCRLWAPISANCDHRPCHSLFLSDFIQHGLQAYLTYRLEKGKDNIEHHGKELLAHAIHCFLESAQNETDSKGVDARVGLIELLIRKGAQLSEGLGRTFEISLDSTNWYRLIKALTTAGTDPNVCAEDGIPFWGNYLLHLHRYPGPARTKLEALEMFLKHNANPNQVIESRRQHNANPNQPIQSRRQYQVPLTIWGRFLLQTRSAPAGDDSQTRINACLLLLQYGADSRRRLEYFGRHMPLNEFFRRKFSNEPGISMLLAFFERENTRMRSRKAERARLRN